MAESCWICWRLSVKKIACSISCCSVARMPESLKQSVRDSALWFHAPGFESASMLWCFSSAMQCPILNQIRPSRGSSEEGFQSSRSAASRKHHTWPCEASHTCHRWCQPKCLGLWLADEANDRNSDIFCAFCYRGNLQNEEPDSQFSRSRFQQTPKPSDTLNRCQGAIKNLSQSCQHLHY